jgi:hypothetical protein
MEFPSAPSSLTEPAENLDSLPADKKNLTDLIQNANENFGKYYQLKEKYESWQNWYNTQKQIYDSVK